MDASCEIYRCSSGTAEACRDTGLCEACFEARAELGPVEPPAPALHIKPCFAYNSVLFTTLYANVCRPFSKHDLASAAPPSPRRRLTVGCGVSWWEHDGASGSSTYEAARAEVAWLEGWFKLQDDETFEEAGASDPGGGGGPSSSRSTICI